MNNLFEFDLQFKDNFLIGTDEAGRGPGAGPVFAAAVHFQTINDSIIEELAEINDSKKLTEKKRECLFEIIKENAIYSIQSSSVEEIDEINILQASLLAMKRAVSDVLQQVNKQSELILIDGNKLIPSFNYNQRFLIKGDGKSASVAAASILAKVSRDRFMKELDKEFPQYDWKKNKGYLTQAHINAIRLHGLTKWHRKQFVRKLFVAQTSC